MVATRHSARYLTALLLTPLLLLSGCGKFNAGFVIEDENHVDATLTVGVLKSVLDEFTGSEAEEVTKELRDCSELKKSYELDENAADKMTVKPFDDDKYLGCTVTGTMTVAELTGQASSSSSSAKPSTTPSKGFAGDGPIFIAFDDDKIRFRLDGSDLQDAISGFGSSELGGSAKGFDFKVSVTFPGKVLSHSGASKVDGKTVTWTDIEDLESYSGLEASGQRGGGFPGSPLVVPLQLWSWTRGRLPREAVGHPMLLALSLAQTHTDRELVRGLEPYGFQGSVSLVCTCGPTVRPHACDSMWAC